MSGPNAPDIPRYVYLNEKATFAGFLIGSVLYGIIIVLFFQCMAALFNPVHRRGERVKWWLVSYTVVMCSVATVLTAMNLYVQSISYIDNRKFPGVGDSPPPGPLGYQVFSNSTPLVIIPNTMFVLNNWLADGLLLYRCYIIYSMNLWVIAFPCLMYLGSLAMGIMLTYQTSKEFNRIDFGVPYFSISLSLNILLTLMIVIRLLLHTRNTRTALGITGVGGLCKTIITMLVESCILYAVSSLLVIGPWAADIPVANAFLAILPEIQVIAPLLIIHRVANKSALTSNTIVSQRLNSFKVRSRRRSTGGSGATPGEGLMSSVDEHEMNPGELGART